MVKIGDRIVGNVTGFDSVIPIIRTPYGDFNVYQLSQNGNTERETYIAYTRLKIGDEVEATVTNTYLGWAEFEGLYS